MNDYLDEMEYEAYVDSWNMPLMSFEDWKDWRDSAVVAAKKSS